MKNLFLVLAFGFSWINASLLGATEVHWVAFEVPAAKEAELIKTLEAQSVTALAWSNAVVEVSGFYEVELTPVSELASRLTPQDPRWDPWLRSLKPYFVPVAGVSRLWVPEAQQALVASLISKEGSTTRDHHVAPSSAPRKITGWLVLFAALLFGGLRVIVGILSGFPPLRSWKSWVWAPSVVLALLVATLMVAGFGGAALRTEPTPRSTSSWSQHLWFQQSWPFGAAWADWKPGKPWTYPSAERRDGRLVSTVVALVTPDSLWLSAALAARDRHHAGQIFSAENP